MNNILYIAPQDSFPCTDGGKMGIFFPLKEFAKKYNIFYAFPIQKINSDTISKYKEFNIVAIPYQMNLKDNYFHYPKTLLSSMSFKFSKFYNKYFLKNLEELIEKNNIDTIWVCHAQMAQYAIELKKIYPNIKLYLREYNIEYKLVKQYIYSQKNLFMKFIGLIEYLKTKKFEINLWNKFDNVFFISDSDLITAKKYNKNINNSNLVYIGIESSDTINNTNIEKNSFIFTGNLQSFQNQYSLKYFIKNIWKPFINQVPDAKLYITGNELSFLISKLKMPQEELNQNNIINLGFVENIKNIILSKQFVISPTLYGSGIRLKVLEALSLKKIVFVSDIDYKMVKCFEDMKNVVHYTNQKDFYDKYKQIIDNEQIYAKISNSAYNLINDYFNWNICINELLEKIK